MSFFERLAIMNQRFTAREFHAEHQDAFDCVSMFDETSQSVSDANLASNSSTNSGDEQLRASTPSSIFNFSNLIDSQPPSQLLENNHASESSPLMSRRFNSINLNQAQSPSLRDQSPIATQARHIHSSITSAARRLQSSNAIQSPRIQSSIAPAACRSESPIANNKPKNKRTKRSDVWEYFHDFGVSDQATCRLCQLDVARTGGNTKGMIAHLQSSTHEELNFRSDDLEFGKKNSLSVLSFKIFYKLSFAI